MHKVLFIGVGGTGGKALRFAWREIDRRLRIKDWAGDSMPSAFQFLHFDLPEEFDGYKDRDVPRVLSLDDKMYRTLAEGRRPYRSYDAALVQEGLLPSLAGWRPHPVDDIAPPYLGAGQRRSVGRVATISALRTIDESIGHAATALQSAEVTNDLHELDRMFNVGAEESLREGHVFVVGSLAGGSGSGMFLDVIERVKAHSLSWFSNVHLVAITPDVFETLNPGEREGTQANSFAALAEYLAAFSCEGDHHPHEARVQGSVGVSGRGGRRTGDYAFLIGRGNGSVTFNEPGEVYRCVGKALAAFATTPEIQSYFDSVVCGLSGSTAYPQYFFADRGTSPLQPVGSFGFGTVGVGGDLLGEFAAQVLARRCLERLLCLSTGGRSYEEHVRARTEGTDRDTFFEASGLWEYDPERPEHDTGDGSGDAWHDQVLDALRDANAVRKEIEEQVKNRVIDLFAKDRKVFAGADEAFREFDGRFAEKAREYEARAADSRSTRAREWTLRAQTRLLDATTDVASRDGLPVAVELLDQLMTQITDALGHLDDEGSKAARREGQHRDGAKALYSRVKGKITGPAEAHRNAARLRTAALWQQLEHSTRREASQLLADAKSNLVAPLHARLEAYSNLLETERRDKDKTGAGAVVERWPRDAVPASLLPAPNELLLISPDSFPDELTRLIATTTGLEAPEDAYGEAVAEVVFGGWVDTREPGRTKRKSQTLVKSLKTWNPGIAFAQREGSVSSADFQIDASVLGILDRAREWVKFRQGPLAQAVNQSLVEYLDPSHPHQARRAQSLVTALTVALNCARPLLAIDNEIRKLVHGDATETSLTMSPLPIGPKHPARERVEGVLSDFGIPTSNLSQHFTTDPGTAEIDIFGFMTKSVHPVVVSSVMRPIAGAWSQAAGNRGRREAFWQFRRSRTLEMFLPLAASHQRAIVRGWYVAALLGYLDGLDGDETATKVWGSAGWLAFPHPLLGRRVTRRQDVLPALLESFPLCFLDVSLGSDESTKAYARLIELGQTRTEDEDGTPTELERWLHSGDREHGKPKVKGPVPPLPARFEALKGSESDFERRQAATLEALEDPRKNYEEVAALELDPEAFLVDRRWEIAGLVLSALGELIQFVRDAEPPTEWDSDPLNI